MEIWAPTDNWYRGTRCTTYKIIEYFKPTVMTGATSRDPKQTSRQVYLVDLSRSCVLLGKAFHSIPGNTGWLKTGTCNTDGL